MSHLYQVWVVPGLNLTEPLQLGNGIVIRAVLAQPPERPPFACTLLQIEAIRKADSDSPEPQFRQLGQVLTRLSFALLIPFSAFSARVIPTGLKKDDDIAELVFPGAPPGIALSEVKLGFRKAVNLVPAFLTDKVAQEVEVAIGWFLSGNGAANSIQQILCHWIGLESLAPVVEGAWRCPTCEKDLPQCPACGQPTTGPKAVQTVRAFLRNDLGVAKAEYESLYSLRCRVAHGALPLDPDGLIVASKQAARIQELLLKAIKRALGWPLDGPPNIDQQGMTIVGAPGLDMRSKAQTDDLYDQPGVYPA